MTLRRWSVAVLLLAGAGAEGPAFGQSMGPDKSIFPPYSASLFPAPSLQGSVTATGPRWPSAEADEQKLANGTLALSDFATSHGNAAYDAIKDGALIDEDALLAVGGIVTSAQVSAAVDTLRDKALRDTAEWQAGFLSKLGNALTVLDFVSVAARGAGYLYEGDATGAAGVVANEAAKKTAEAVGAFGFSWAPGGAIYGSWAGNKAWEKYVKPKIDAHEQALREAELKRQIANKPWLQEKEYLDAKGNVRRMEVDQYIDPDSRLVKTRDPDDQAKFEAAAHADWKSRKAMAKIESDHAAGNIDDQRLREVQTSFRNRVPWEPWEPPDFALIPEPDLPEMEVPEADASDEAESDAAASSEETVIETYDELSDYRPVQVTASGSWTETFEHSGDVTIRLEFAFWNLGAYARDHERAVLQVTMSGSMVGSHTMVGVFSGGPNGTLVFQDEEGAGGSFRVEGGTVLVGEVPRFTNGTEVLRMPISNPGAFADWPKDLR